LPFGKNSTPLAGLSCDGESRGGESTKPAAPGVVNPSNANRLGQDGVASATYPKWGYGRLL